MSEPMSKSFKESVEEFKKWSENGSERIDDTKSGTSPRPRYQTPYESIVSPALFDLDVYPN